MPSARAELERVRRTAPAVGDHAALVRFASPMQVHPIVATTWARRLAPRLVVAANDGDLEGRVNVSCRGGGERPIGELLREALVRGGGDLVEHAEFAHGHARASGGSLPPEDIDRLLRGLGLDR